MMQIDEYKRLKTLKSLDKKIKRNEWDQAEMPTSWVNAGYDPQRNSINIFAGVLNGVCYQSDFTDEQKLGTIAVIIGHEISHAFDPSGSQFDKEGRLASWWTDEDSEAFEERSQKLIAYYDQFEPIEGIKYSGKRVQGEAIADIGGMKCALRIASKYDNFNYREFFEAYARVWALVRLKASVIDRAKTNEHPLGYLRCNVPVQQFDEFYETYDIKEGDGMYLAPDDRISVW